VPAEVCGTEHAAALVLHAFEGIGGGTFEEMDTALDEGVGAEDEALEDEVDNVEDADADDVVDADAIVDVGEEDAFVSDEEDGNSLRSTLKNARFTSASTSACVKMRLASCFG
jgi:hypothetical protein